MSTQTLIELRQEDDVSGDDVPSEFTVNLVRPLSLLPGDQVIMSHAFIDTVETADQIVIPEDIDVSGTFCVWMQDWLDPPAKNPTAGSELAQTPEYVKAWGIDPTKPPDFTQANTNGNYLMPGFFLGCELTAHAAAPPPPPDPSSPPLSLPTPAVTDNVLLTDSVFFLLGYKDHGKTWGGVTGQFEYSFVDASLNVIPVSFTYYFPPLIKDSEYNHTGHVKFDKIGILFGDQYANDPPKQRAIRALNPDELEAASIRWNNDGYWFWAPPNDPGIGKRGPNASTSPDRDPYGPPHNPQDSGTAIVDNTFVFTPKAFPFEFTVPRGVYAPTTLATLVTQLMSMNKTSLTPNSRPGTSIAGTPHGISSDFIYTSEKFDAWINATPGEDDPDVTKPSNRNFFVINNKLFLTYCGASQLALTWSDDTQRFSWSFLHTPLATTAGPEVQFISINKTQAQGRPNWIATGHSGIIFQSLKPTSFFEDILGFETAQLCPNITMSTQERPMGLVELTGSIVPNINLVPGINVVTAYAGIDVGIVKDASDLNEFWQVGIPSAAVPTSLTWQITAPGSYLTDNNQSHFVVEIDGIPTREMVSATEDRLSVGGIVGRYQTRGTYTQGDSGSALPLTHRGAPMSLSSFTVRVLNPDGTPAEVGTRSVVYLTLERPLPQPAIQPAQEEQPAAKRRK